MSHAHPYEHSRFVEVTTGVTPQARLPWPHAVYAALQILRTWVARSRQRNELRELDDRLLRDIGVTPEQARKEARKLFWLESSWLE